MSTTILVDLHCHSAASKDSTVRLKTILDECDRKGIAKIAITDHNSVNGALEAAARWPDRIIPGVEVMTRKGELLGYYVKEAVPAMLSPRETIEALKSQGAVVSVSHPFDRWRNGGWKTASLNEILPSVDAVEVFNAHCFSDKPNKQAAAFCQKHHLSGTAGSDAHFLDDIGRAGLCLDDFDDSQGLRRSLLTASIFGKRIGLGMRLISLVVRFMISS